MRSKKLAGLAVVAGVMMMYLAGCTGNKIQTKEQKMSQNQVEHERKEDEMSDKRDMKEEMMNNGMTKTAKANQMDDGIMKNDEAEEMKDDMKKVEKVNDGDSAFDFTLQDGEGNSFTLSDMQGEKVYIKFWASWCPICLSGLEELNELAKEEKDFEIITVVAPGSNGEKNKEDFIKWFDSLGYDNVKVLFDESGDVLKEYGVRAYPTSAIIGTDGVLTGIYPGHMDKDTIHKTLEAVK